MNEYTTRTDGVGDDGTVDVGYHYSSGTDYDNHSPSLSGGDLDPDSGTTDTTFVYSVHYYDQDGDQPVVASVCIDEDMGHDMTLQDSAPADGTYMYHTDLPGGEHVFYFYFEDSTGSRARAPEAGCFLGPSMHQDDVGPISSCSAPDGTNQSPITVEYTSSDGGYGIHGTLSGGGSGVALVKARRAVPGGRLFLFWAQFQQSCRQLHSCT